MTRLYLITPPRLELGTFLLKAASAFEGGDVACMQLRLKDASEEEITEAAKALLPLCHKHECALVLNDRPDLVASLGLDGVHLGQEDLEQWPIHRAREAVGDERILGITAHASLHLAMEAGDAGADYVAFGAFFPTKSKSPEKLAKWGTPDVQILEQWAEIALLPCVAIGGMTPANCPPIARAGADFIAAITAVWEHPEGPAAAVHAFNQALGAPKQ